MAFWVKYLAVAAILSVAVYIGAPMLGKRAPEENASPNDSVEQATATYGETTSDTGAESDQKGVLSAVKRTISGGIVKVLPSRKEQPSAPQQGEQEVVVENVVNYTPSTDRVPSSGADVKFWGVTINDATAYDREGHKQDKKVPGGSLVEVTDTVSSSRGETALCRIRYNNAWVGPCLIATVDLIRFEGGREEVDAGDVDKLCDYYALNAKMLNRAKELEDRVLSANPHYAELKRKATVYKAHAARAKELTEKRDSAKGADRSKIIAELTQLKNSEAREASELNALTKKYEDWKKAHPNSAKANLESDSVYSECSRRMEALKRDLAVFGL